MQGLNKSYLEKNKQFFWHNMKMNSKLNPLLASFFICICMKSSFYPMDNWKSTRPVYTKCWNVTHDCVGVLGKKTWRKCVSQCILSKFTINYIICTVYYRGNPVVVLSFIGFINLYKNIERYYFWHDNMKRLFVEVPVIFVTIQFLVYLFDLIINCE